jgi:DNA-binding GntR family transcriptional regulator
MYEMVHPSATNNQQRQSLRDEVFHYLHDRVIEGVFQPGEWLRQEEIASQLGVSMTPVREALDLVVAAGLAERVPYRGVRVVELSRDEMLDAYGLRLLLEPSATRLAASRADPDRVQELRRIHAQTVKLVALADMSQLRQLSRAFHAQVVTMSGDPLLARLYQIVANKFPDWMLYEAMFHHPEKLSASLRAEQKQHLTILNAISAKDSEAASRAARDHILSLGKDLQTYFNIPAELILKKEKQFIPR